MSQTGLGAALKRLRERRGLSTRELGKLAEIDHAYIHRLETGEKTSPSDELTQRLLNVLKPNERDGKIVKWLVEHPDTGPELVEYTLDQPDIDIDIFTIAAGTRHRGAGRPEPAILIERVRRAWEASQD
jgi:HTH-type transcriptional regulator, competence development regulator